MHIMYVCMYIRMYVMYVYNTYIFGSMAAFYKLVDFVMKQATTPKPK